MSREDKRPKSKARNNDSSKGIPSKQAPKSPARSGEDAERAAAAESWLLQCPPGLANVLKKEMVFNGALDRKQDVFIKRQRNHDLIFVNRLKSDEKMNRLRIPEVVLRCPVFGRFKISKRQLEIMANTLKELGTRRLVVSVAGRVFNRQDLSRWLAKEMSERGYDFEPGTEEEVWMFCIDEAYYFGIPVKKSRHTEGRDERTEERHGSLPPPVAAALAFAAMPKNDDVILDPTCGSGTLLAEAHAYAPAAKLTGIDIDPEAVSIARKNLLKIAGVTISKGDSRKLDLPPGEITLVMSNLPFGVQFGSKPDNPQLYKEILTEMLRLRNPDRWRAILFTSDVESLRGACATFKGYSLTEMFKVKVRGELASCFKLESR